MNTTIRMEVQTVRPLSHWHAHRRAVAHRRCDRAEIAFEIARAHRDRLDPPPVRIRTRTVIVPGGVRILVVDPVTDPLGVAHVDEWGPLG